MKNRGNILLLHASFNDHLFGESWKLWQSVFAPSGLLYIASPLLKVGYKITLIDLNVEKFTESDFYNQIGQYKYILITCYNGTIHNVRKIIRKIREDNNEIKILCGGPYCIMSRDEFIEGSDFTCIGEAENYIADILDRIVNKTSLHDIPGILYRKNGKVINTGGIMKVENLDVSLPPAIELVKGKDYGYISGMKLSIAPIISSRGCPFSCAYCTFKISGYRVRSVQNIINEIKQIVKKGYKYILFSDDNFLINKKRVHKIMDKIIEEKIRVSIFLTSRVDDPDYELYKKMRKAGVIMILFGIESANQDVLDFYNKKTTVEKAKMAVTLANKAGILVFGYIMIGAPFETEKHLKINMKFLDRYPIDIMTIGILRYERGTKLWDDLCKRGLVHKDTLVFMTNKDISNYSLREWLEIQEKLLKHFYLNPRRIIRIIVKAFRLRQVSLLKKFLKNNNISSFFNYIKTFSSEDYFVTN